MFQKLARDPTSSPYLMSSNLYCIMLIMEISAPQKQGKTSTMIHRMRETQDACVHRKKAMKYRLQEQATDWSLDRIACLYYSSMISRRRPIDQIQTGNHGAIAVVGQFSDPIDNEFAMMVSSCAARIGLLIFWQWDTTDTDVIDL